MYLDIKRHFSPIALFTLKHLIRRLYESVTLFLFHTFPFLSSDNSGPVVCLYAHPNRKFSSFVRISKYNA